MSYYCITTSLGSIMSTSLFRVIDIPTYDMIFSMTWLEQNNLLIDWRTKEIKPHTQHTMTFLDAGKVLRELEDDNTTTIVHFCATERSP